jgi:hypothetical protein
VPRQSDLVAEWRADLAAAARRGEVDEIGDDRAGARVVAKLDGSWYWSAWFRGASTAGIADDRVAALEAVAHYFDRAGE